MTGTNRQLTTKAVKLAHTQGLLLNGAMSYAGLEVGWWGKASAHLRAKQLLFDSPSECKEKQLASGPATSVKIMTWFTAAAVSLKGAGGGTFLLLLG
jgi:hypothetical protein